MSVACCSSCCAMLCGFSGCALGGSQRAALAGALSYPARSINRTSNDVLPSMVAYRNRPHKCAARKMQRTLYHVLRAMGLWFAEGKKALRYLVVCGEDERRAALVAEALCCLSATLPAPHPRPLQAPTVSRVPASHLRSTGGASEQSGFTRGSSVACQLPEGLRQRTHARPRAVRVRRRMPTPN